MTSQILINPYRLFFPLAWLMGLWGGLVWILFAAGVSPFPAITHPQSMSAGFLMGHVMGFLLTAGPKFTGTGPLKPLELGIAALCYVVLCFAAIFQVQFTFGLFALSAASLAVILGLRISRKTKGPPAEFVFLPFGLAAAFIGAIIKMLGATSAVVSPFVSQLGNLFVYEAFILSLVLGVGSRLAPFLLGHAGAPDAVSIANKTAPLGWPFIWSLILFWFSYIWEALLAPSGALDFARLLRASVVVYVLARHWRLFRFPQSATRQAWGLWSSAWMMSLGLFASAITAWQIHSLHLFYIGGLGLLTLMVATRVSLAHGSKRLLLERTSKVLYPVVGLVIGAALVRFIANFSGSSYIETLAIAASLWVIGLFIWGVVFLIEGSRQSPGSADD